MNTEKRKFRFNYVDVIIILLVAAVFVLAYKFINGSVNSASDMPEVSFTVEVKGVPEEYKTMFKKGDVVRDALKGDTLGTIVDVTPAPATELLVDSLNGKYVIGEYENREDVYITIKGVPTSFGADVVIAQQNIKVGKMLYFKKPGAVGRGFIVKMDVEGAEAND